MDDATLDGLLGIRIKRKDRKVLLMRAKRWEAAFGVAGDRMLKELKQQSRLQTAEGYQLQIKVRRNKAKDRMYAIVTD